MSNNPQSTLTDLLDEPSRRRCRFSPPSRAWEQGADGLWSSREWRKGEKEKYALEVLGQKAESPYALA